MFKVFFWAFKVNAAIAGFGISPNVFERKFRFHVQELGKNAGLTPQETALILLSLKVGIHYSDAFELVLNTLRFDGKIDDTKPEVIDALYEMGYSVFPRWQSDAITVFMGTYDEELDDIDDYAKSPIAQIFVKFRLNEIKKAEELINRIDVKEKEK